MKTQTIKALQDLCDALMYDVQPQPYPWTRTKNAADILSRVLDEEPKEKEHNVTED